MNTLRLTRRGRLLLAALALAILAAVAYVAILHPPIYGNCRDTLDGRVCEIVDYR